MAARKTRRRTESETSPEGAGLALVASAIGHILQATKNANLEQEKNQLLTVLREWQTAFHRRNSQFRDLWRAYETLTNQVDQLERHNAELLGQNFDLRRRVLELERAR